MFRPEEQFGLRHQMRRAAVSVAANIAEGCCRDGRRELVRFLHIALFSASELEYYFLLASDLGILPIDDCKRALSSVARVKRMLAGLIGTLRRVQKDAAEAG